MSSNLRQQASFAPVDAQAVYQTSSALPAPTKNNKMSLTRSYFIASTARAKLGKEASRADHDLRVLVGHANLLDTLMIELSEAEQQQEAWFNDSVRAATPPKQQSQHIQWMDSVVEEADEGDSSDGESDDESIYDEDAELENFAVPLRRLKSPPVEFSSNEIDEDYESEEDEVDQEMFDEMGDDEIDDDMAPLSRVSSRHSPPELTHESDSDSEDDSMPPSPENTVLDYSEKERQAMTTTTFYDADHKMNDFLPRQPQAPLIAAC